MRIRRPSSHELQRGQALVLIALAFIGLAAFIGLTVDAGILFSHIGHLRRATDAASLAAANQFREGRTPKELSDLAAELIRLNGLTPSAVVAQVCDLSNYPSPPKDPLYHDETLCFGSVYPKNLDDPQFKDVRVEAELPVKFAFLPIIGWGEVTIAAESISQAASLDLVLVIDNSPSMAFDLCRDMDDDDEDFVDDDCNGFPTPQNGPTSDADADRCNDSGTCEPFEKIRSAALGLLANMFFPYDRMAVVTFAQLAEVPLSLSEGTSFGAVEAAINELKVSGPAPNPPCDLSGGDPRGCPTTNTALGLTLGGSLFADNDNDRNPLEDDSRGEAVWILILLSDGAANAAIVEGGNASDRNDWICPPAGGPAGSPTWVSPLCRDPDFEIGEGEFGFDAEDAAVDAGLFVGCPDSTVKQPDFCKRVAPGGQNALIFTIGYGNLVIDSPACSPVYPDPPGCQPNQGEELLRYIADIGDELDPRQCESKAPSTLTDPVNCGNYFFAADKKQLEKVFEEIATRIFAKITH